jgi:hypothetical protein
MLHKVDFTMIPLGSRPADPQVWLVLTEQASAGQAILFQAQEGGYLVGFPDEPEPIPFECLAYHSELGLYDKRQFPTI